jgi:hypothetical protein
VQLNLGQVTLATCDVYYSDGKSWTGMEPGNCATRSACVARTIISTGSMCIVAKSDTA